MTKKLTLGKNERLKSRKLIDQLFSEGKKFGIAPFRIFYLHTSSEKPVLQCGVGVSSKNFKKSVERNKIKRLMREAYRLQKSLLADCIKEKNYSLNMFVIYTGKELPVYADVHDKMKKILDKLCDILNKGE